ncbi:MAG: hypothetical protein P8N49_07445 [Opitutales bacterium]|nr:hypothetical protein [Opitutales bacterium]
MIKQGYKIRIVTILSEESASALSQFTFLASAPKPSNKKGGSIDTRIKLSPSIPSSDNYLQAEEQPAY